MTIESIQQLAIDLTTEQMLHLAAMHLVEGAGASEALQLQRANGLPDVISFETKHGDRSFGASNALNIVRQYPQAVSNISRSWAAGALLTLGDALERENYLDHAAPLELVYHLRNGVAHGNAFKFTAAGRKRLERYEACVGQSGPGALYVVSQDLHGTSVLDEFVSAGDVHTILLAVVSHLSDLRSPDAPPASSHRVPD